MATKQMTAEQVVAALNEVAAAMHEQFPKHTTRLEQLGHHIGTAAMAVQHLFDEQARADHDRTERIRKAAEDE